MTCRNCKCTGSAQDFHRRNLNHCKYVNQYYIIRRTKDPASRNHMYIFLRLLGHEYLEALNTANRYHEFN